MENLVAALLPRQATDVLPPVAAPTEIPTALPTVVPTSIPTDIGTLIPSTTATAAATPRPTTDIPFGWVVEGNRAIPWWYSKEGVIVKWSLFLGMIVFFAVFLSVSYTHAKRRMAKGQLPLRYHRWMISKHKLARIDPQYAYPQSNYRTYRPQQDVYGMYAMPPPVYDPGAPRPPIYEPPQGATKADPSQWRSEPTRRPADGAAGSDFAPPSGPPPSFGARP